LGEWLGGNPPSLFELWRDCAAVRGLGEVSRCRANSEFLALRLTSVDLGLALRKRVVAEEGGSIVKRGTVLLIEDCPKDQQDVQDVLQAQGYTVTTISDPERALSTVEEWAKQYNFVIIQEAMRGRRGMELVHAARLSHKDLPMLVVTRDGDWNGYAQALSEGVVDYFPSPIDHKKLVKAVEGALAQAV
jgi:CheY-like chemotaxis protein